MKPYQRSTAKETSHQAEAVPPVQLDDALFGNIPALVNVVESYQRDLKAMGVQLSATIKEHYRSQAERFEQALRYWREDPRDRLVLFDALARLYKNAPAEFLTGLVTPALRSPQWRMEALQMHPWAFLKHNEGRENRTALHTFADYATREQTELETPESVETFVRALLAIGVKGQEDDQGATAPFLAATNRCEVIAQGFAKVYGEQAMAASVNKQGRTPLHHVCALKLAPDTFKSVAARLLSWGVDPERADKFGGTPLTHLAAIEEDIESIRHLIELHPFSAGELEKAIEQSFNDDITGLLQSQIALQAVNQASSLANIGSLRSLP